MSSALSTPTIGEPLTFMNSWVGRTWSIASATKPCDQAFRARSILRDAIGAGARLLQEACVGFGKRRVVKERARLGTSLPGIYTR